MKRLIISGIIIGLIISVGVFAIFYISAENNRLLGKVREVSEGYRQNEDISILLNELSDISESYSKRLCFIVNDELLRDITDSCASLESYYYAQSDEFTSKCREISRKAEAILLGEIPNIGTIL